jgi:hypothetical protein
LTLGGDAPEDLYRWSKRLMEAEREGAVDAPRRQAAVEAHRNRMRVALGQMKALYEAGRVQQKVLAEFAFYEAEAEHWLDAADSAKGK